ncbi:hypothetical protein B0E37_05113 [Streptomyces sp. MH192]|nr:hypothetical protein [Streptomyces sp. MH192]
MSSSRSSHAADEASSGAAVPDNSAPTAPPATSTEPSDPAPRWAGHWPLSFPENAGRPHGEDSQPESAEGPLDERETTSTTPDTGTPHTLARTRPATLHGARNALKQLIDAAIQGHPTPLTRGPHHALLTTPAHATELGWDLIQAPTHSIADARRQLGDLVQYGAQGHPQVLCRHKTPIAVLIAAAADGTPAPPAPHAEPAPDTAAPDSISPPEGLQTVQNPLPATPADEAAKDLAPAPVTTPVEAAIASTLSSEPQPEPAAHDTPAPADTPPAGLRSRDARHRPRARTPGRRPTSHRCAAHPATPGRARPSP